MVMARRQLAVLWLLSGFGLIIIFTLFNINQHFSGVAPEIGKRLAPMIVPTMTLVIGVLIGDMLNPGRANYAVDRHFYLVTFWMSVVYLLALLLVTCDAAMLYTMSGEDLAQLKFPHTQGSNSTPPSIVIMDSASWGLSVLQGLVALALGAFFVQGNPQADTTEAPSRDT